MKLEAFYAHRTPRAFQTEVHSHGYWEIVLTEGSSGELRIAGRKLSHADGDVHVVAPHVHHAWHGTDPCLHYCLGVNGAELADLDPAAYTADARVRRLFKTIREELNARRPHYRNLIELHAREIVLLLKRSALADGRRSDPPRDAASMEKVRALIDDHYTSKLDLASLSESVFLSKDYIRHAFKSEFGVSPIKYLISRRVDKAAELLRQTSFTVREIAFTCGFEDEYYFSRMFKKLKGVSPLAFRRGLSA